MSTAGSEPAARRLAVMLSGSGRTLLNLLDYADRGALRASIPLVIASRPCSGAEHARARGLATLVIPGHIPGPVLGQTLRDHGIDLVALAGYLRMLEVPEGFRHRIVNIHPSLLPAFGGRALYGDKVHAAVLAHGCKVSGCTVHFVDEHYDTGPIIAQEAVPVADGDTIQTLAARVFEAERRLYPRTLQLVLDGRVRVEGRVVRVEGEAGSDRGRGEEGSSKSADR